MLSGSLFSPTQSHPHWTTVKTLIWEKQLREAPPASGQLHLPDVTDHDRQGFPALALEWVPWSALWQPPVLLRVPRSCPLSWQHQGGAFLGADFSSSPPSDGINLGT